jgi:hypothetical protein
MHDCIVSVVLCIAMLAVGHAGVSAAHRPAKVRTCSSFGNEGQPGRCRDRGWQSHVRDGEVGAADRLPLARGVQRVGACASSRLDVRARQPPTRRGWRPTTGASAWSRLTPRPTEQPTPTAGARRWQRVRRSGAVGQLCSCSSAQLIRRRGLSPRAGGASSSSRLGVVALIAREVGRSGCDGRRADDGPRGRRLAPSSGAVHGSAASSAKGGSARSVRPRSGVAVVDRSLRAPTRMGRVARRGASVLT